MSSICVTVVDGALQVSSVTCEYILMSQEQVSQLVSGQFDWSLLEFDKELYELVLTQTLISFIIGHVLGRILKTFGKL
ncbi:transcriptional regulator [Candidatus Enterovibrio escicola]|uniref:transcriptional regulator n=1 Tax=Candidatus Enterovibrio escicola TaxID=1927127 RepID=UPI0012381071|nr:transcriptional regulator [Candidatus Enterovibrio escacola]